MRSITVFKRSIAFFAAISLGLPGTSFALRPVSPVESGVQDQLVLSLSAGLEEEKDLGLRRRVDVGGQVVVWSFNQEQPPQIVRIRLAEVKGMKRGAIEFQGPPTVLIFRQKLWDQITREVTERGGFNSGGGRGHLQTFVKEVEEGKWLKLNFKAEKDYRSKGTYPPGERGEGVILYDLTSNREIARVFLRAVASNSSAELRLVAPKDVKLDDEATYLSKLADLAARPIPYDEAILIDDSALVPVRLFADTSGGAPNSFVPVPSQGVFIPSTYLEEWRGRGFFILNRQGNGQRFLHVVLGNKAHFPNVNTVFMQAGADPVAARLSLSRSSRTEDGFTVEVTPQGVTIRPGSGQQILVERSFIPFEMNLRSLFEDAGVALEMQRWSTLSNLLTRVSRLQKPERARQTTFVRRQLDTLEIMRMQMLLSRRLPSVWIVGNPLSRSAENDYWAALAAGSRLLNQQPPPHQETVRMVRTMIAQAVLTLSAAGSLAQRTRIDQIMTNPDVPRGHVYALFRERWLARVLREQERGRLELPNEFYTRALAYALMQVMSPADQFLSPADRLDAPDALLTFLQGGVPADHLESARQRHMVRRIVTKELWNVEQSRPGQMPEDMMEEVLMPYDITILEAAAIAARVLSRVAEEMGHAGDAAKFRQLSEEIQEQLRGRVSGRMPRRLDMVNVVRGPVQILADNLREEQEVIETLHGHMKRLLEEVTEEPRLDPGWVRFYNEATGSNYWIELGPPDEWQERFGQEGDLMESALWAISAGAAGRSFRVQVRTYRERHHSRWVQVLVPEVTYGPPLPDQPERLVMPSAGLEGTLPFRAVDAEEFARNLPSRYRDSIPGVFSRVWVVPLPARVNVYSQEPLLQGLERDFIGKLPADLAAAVRLVRVPLAPTESYEKPGVIVEDAGLDLSVDNPLNLPVLKLWLADLARINPAAVIMLALGGYQDPNVQLLGLMTYQDAQGQTFLAIFA
ncbi:MAG: hypothetical protein NC910_00300 [Candidatus Omnitrophica bacterium]|nr:hypothetical protein [Candidatus Omnitrophota bacterium]